MRLIEIIPRFIKFLTIKCLTQNRVLLNVLINVHCEHKHLHFECKCTDTNEMRSEGQALPEMKELVTFATLFSPWLTLGQLFKWAKHIHSQTFNFLYSGLQRNPSCWHTLSSLRRLLGWQLVVMWQDINNLEHLAASIFAYFVLCSWHYIFIVDILYLRHRCFVGTLFQFVHRLLQVLNTSTWVQVAQSIEPLGHRD